MPVLNFIINFKMSLKIDNVKITSDIQKSELEPPDPSRPRTTHFDNPEEVITNVSTIPNILASPQRNTRHHFGLIDRRNLRLGLWQ